MILVRNVVPEMAERLFDPAAVERMKATHAQRVIPGTPHQRVEHMVRHVGGDIQLPAELADIGHAVGARNAVANLDLLHRAEWEVIVREALRDQRLQEVARLRPHHRHHRLRHRNVHGKAVRTVRDVPFNPVQVATHRRRRGDDEIFIGRKPCDGHIGLDATTLIQELRVDNPPVRHRDIVAANPLQDSFGITPDNPDLAEARQVEHAGTVANGEMLVSAVIKPVLTLPAIFIGCLLAGIVFCLRQEPVGPLPSADLAKAGTTGLQPVMDRRLPHAACRLDLTVGEVVRIEKPERFRHTGAKIASVGLERLHATDVDIPQIDWRIAGIHPFGEHHAGAAG